MASSSSAAAFTLPPFNLRRLPHLTDYLPDIDPITNPIDGNPFYKPSPSFYLSSSDVILRDIVLDISSPAPTSPEPSVAYLRAGPRREIFFNPPSDVHAAVVTCGGLCPGTNTVVRELVIALWDLYGVRQISGVRGGYRGFNSPDPPPIELDPAGVHGWHKLGGTALGTSRGGFDLDRIVDGIARRGYDQIYIVGGDGTMKGAAKICAEIRRRGMKVAVAGIPKTVDNDVGVIDRSFGFLTAVEAAQGAIAAAHVEAESAAAINGGGVGIVKLMGRSAGHIALHGALSSGGDVDCVLIPEIPFYLRGAGGLFEFLAGVLRRDGHAVVVVAEGAGQDLVPRASSPAPEDESGNSKLVDVGPWIKTELERWWKEKHGGAGGEVLTVKYIDPTYMIRAVPANAADNLACTLLAHSAIHGAMAGYTGFVAGAVNGNYGYVPVEEVAAAARKTVDTKDHKWAWVRSVTNQPDFERTTTTV